MHLRRRQSGAVGVPHGFDHIGDQMADFRGGGVMDLTGSHFQDRVPHPGDFQQCHSIQYGPGPGSGKAGKPVLSPFFTFPQQKPSDSCKSSFTSP
jgi:hypothetical protein